MRIPPFRVFVRDPFVWEMCDYSIRNVRTLYYQYISFLYAQETREKNGRGDRLILDSQSVYA